MPMQTVQPPCVADTSTVHSQKSMNDHSATRLADVTLTP